MRRRPDTIMEIPPASPRPPAVSAAPPHPDAGRQRWWAVMEFRIGVLPLPVVVILGVLFATFIVTGKFPAGGKTPQDVCTMLAVLAVGGFVCAEIGKRIPLIKDIGGAARAGPQRQGLSCLTRTVAVEVLPDSNR